MEFSSWGWDSGASKGRQISLNGVMVRRCGRDDFLVLIPSDDWLQFVLSKTGKDRR